MNVLTTTTIILTENISRISHRLMAEFLSTVHYLCGTDIILVVRERTEETGSEQRTRYETELLNRDSPLSEMLFSSPVILYARPRK